VANQAKRALIGLLVFAHAQRVFFIVAVIASVMIMSVLHSDAPSRMSESTSIMWHGSPVRLVLFLVLTLC